MPGVGGVVEHALAARHRRLSLKIPCQQPIRFCSQTKPR
jgi:hypothetical protein